ncbi:glucose-6-phosphate isomerase [Maritimibacter sp. UBA3975]|uniref:glucose-6-phosphate isomerase n=1 Tax=Maritimibacter sp. UBA3975 TaxID=1946833 RepID=UPI000C0903E9|nr:glucose-6-phosphate isomerase [Maritimibacter sp. UBA3975]MAM60339.1 glucose-6-phosphate isomerase [Maritimibacter sp.]|tara:strand:- start:3423 stop:5039 length:1617 start_codon:yes stop_codon:yes gene_type:complete
MTWKKLASHRAKQADVTIAALLEDPDRATGFSLRMDDMLFDYSKTTIDDTARDLLLGLAESAGVAARREAMFTGEKINETEGRAVLHTALRDPGPEGALVDGEPVLPGVHETLDRMEEFAEGLRTGKVRPVNGGRFTDVVNIGIGGSDLGPAMATLALAPFHDGPRMHYVSNVDGAHIHDTLQALDPKSTLVIVASKTFTTIETMTNAETAREWLRRGIGESVVGRHFAALSSAVEKTTAWGIDPSRVFGFEDWVGGRYSVWGPVGLGLMIAVGAKRFREFLAGGHEMDVHFREAEGAENMPLMLALVGIWHRQVCGYPTRAVLPYDQRLSRLPAYLQQLEMESNGKSVAMNGTTLDIPSGPVVWGEPGTNGQHAFYQLIHQGTEPVPCEFLVAAKGHEPDLAHQHALLVANCLAQSEALMKGRTLEEAREIMREKGGDPDDLERQALHRVFPGNRPSTTLAYPMLTPRMLGRVIALYEHRVFVEGVILGINSYDQWGVELGKELAVALAPVLSGEEDSASKDPSTRQLVSFVQNNRD